MSPALFATIALATATPDAPERVLVLQLDHTESVTEETARAVTDLVVSHLAKRKSLEVLSSDDVKRLANLGADKQAAGCDDTSCLAELAGALSADRVVFGRLSVLGERTVLNLSLFDAETAKATARASRTFASIDDLEAELPKLVDELVGPRRGPGGKKKGGGPSPMIIAGGVGLGAGALGAVVAAGSVVAGELVLSQGKSFSEDGYRRAQFGFAATTIVGAVLAAAGFVAGGIALGVGMSE